MSHFPTIELPSYSSENKLQKTLCPMQLLFPVKTQRFVFLFSMMVEEL
jgi:hypothetical protein